MKNKEKLNLFICIILSFITIFSLVIHIQYSWDSIHYVDIGKSVASGKGLSTYHLNCLSKNVPERKFMWAPLYSILLGIGKKIGIPFGISARIISIFSFIITTFSLYKIGKILIHSSFGLICSFLWLIVGQEYFVWTYVLTEPLFIALILLSVLLIYKINNNRSFLLGIIIGLASILRYIGITLFISALLFLIIYKKQLKYIFLLSFGFLIFSFPLYLRNLFLSGKITAGIPFLPGKVSFFDNLIRFAFRYIFDMRFIIMVAIAFLLIGYKENKNNKLNEVSKEIISFSIIFIIIYSLALILIFSLWQHTLPDEKYICPIYPLSIPLITYIGVRRLINLFSINKLSLILISSFVIILAVRNAKKDIDLILEEKRNVSKVTEWVKNNTKKDALLIGEAVSWYRFLTDRPVLAPMPPIVGIDVDCVTKFLSKFCYKFSEIYLLIPKPLKIDTAKLITEYKKYGYQLINQNVDGEQIIYKVKNY